MNLKSFFIGTLFISCNFLSFSQSLCITFSTDTVTSCNSYTWTDGKIYTTSDTSAKDTFVNVAGCDSIVTLNLTILESTFDTLNLIACDSVISSTNKVYKSTGIYYDSLINAVGCDSIITTFLVIGDTTLPTVKTKNTTLYLDKTGNATILTSDIDSGTFDNCGIDTIKLSKSSFDCSELGANTVYLIATDVNGNTDSASVTITVKDTINPSAVSKPLKVYIDSTGIAIVDPVDAYNGSFGYCNIASISLSKSVFLCSDVGIDTIYLIVSDNDGNLDSASLVVTVQDTIKPTINTKAAIVSLDSNGNGILQRKQVGNGTSDNCSIANRVLSRTTYDCSDIGTNTVYFIATDVNGNVDSASAIVTVIDTINPTVLTQTLTVHLDASGNGSITATEVDNGSTDNCSIDTMILSKSTFDCSEIGDNLVFLIVTDVNGNVDSASATITVQDTLKPIVLTQPVTVSLDANGSGGIKIADVDNGSTDNCTMASISLSKSSFDCSELGANTVYLIVTDVNGNVDSASATITVQDLIKPTVVNSPDDIALGYCDANYSYPLPTGDDNCSVTVTQVAGLPPGSTFPVGVTVNTFEISDPSGNTVSTSFKIDVRDRYMPFTITDLSLCKNTNKIDLTKGYDNIIFNGSGVESNSKFFNSNSLDPGSYSITAEFLDSMGCTTTEQFEIVIRSIPVMPSIKRIASDQIITTIKYDNYQWYRNGEELTGENKQLLRVNELGIYSVIVGNNENCSQISEGYGFGLPVNDENVTNQGVVKVFPNPTRDFVFIQINDNEDSHLLIVADALGNQLISQETNTNVVKLDISTLAPGNYFLNIFSGTTNETIIIVKK